MKRIQFLVLASLFNCSQSDKVQQPPSPISNNSRTDMICEVILYYKDDSLNSHISKTIEYLENGKVSKEVFDGSDESVNGLYFYYYRDTLLLQERFVDSNQDSTATIYSYDTSGNLMREVHFDYKKRLKPNALKVTDIVNENDYEEEKTWAMTSEVHYKYDDLGKKIESYVPLEHWDSQTRLTWSYDQHGKIREHKSYSHDTLIWTELYSYKEDTIEFTRTWNNSTHVSKILIRLDNNGRFIDELTTDGDDNFINRSKYEYYEDGRIKTRISVDENEAPITTKKYRYVKTPANEVL